MKDAIAGGLAGNRELFFVCSANFNGQQIPGKLYNPTGCCYIASFGKEHCVTDYAVLATSTTVVEYNVVE